MLNDAVDSAPDAVLLHLDAPAQATYNAGVRNSSPSVRHLAASSHPRHELPHVQTRSGRDESRTEMPAALRHMPAGADLWQLLVVWLGHRQDCLRLSQSLRRQGA